MRVRSPLILSIWMLLVAISGTRCRAEQQSPAPSKPVAYYIDSREGNDGNSGTSAAEAWQSFKNIKQGMLHPGDSIRFKRGAAFTGPLYIYDSGTGDNPIVLTDYGEDSEPAPSFTNPVFALNNYGNCVRIKGSFVIVENLYLHHTAAYVRGSYTPSSGWDTTVWEMGAVYIDKEAENCIVRNNEFNDCVVGVKSYGRNAVIRNNYIHDCNRVLKEWGWGPIGIWLGNDYQEASYNRIFNYSAVDPRIEWGADGVGGGADGGAFEIDDARYDKSHISIHHNYTRDCQGFLEITWTDIKQHPVYKSFDIHHNISDDYQQFIAMWQGAECNIENNTIVRRKKNVNDWGVFNITGSNTRNRIRNNLIITELDIQIYNTGLRTSTNPQNIIENNLYYAASGNLVMGKEGPGTAPVFADPLLVKYSGADKPEDFALRTGSPAVNKGLPGLFNIDFFNKPVKGMPDIGAIESGE
ncbi:MAG: hypothetical protein ACTHMV_09900 [Chitinophagaceae bacterium]